jgi:peptidoglycan/xylan/chitin deacetylase (PgdA/CDA1 family)
MTRRTLIQFLAMLVLGGCTRHAEPGSTLVAGGQGSAAPPGGLAPAQVPQFVHFGFDDNGISGRKGSGTQGGIQFALDLFAARSNPAGQGNPRTYDGTPARFSMYGASRYLEVKQIDSPENVKLAWRAVVDAGNEVGIHTHNHPHGAAFSAPQWTQEITTCRDWLTRPFDPARAGDPSTGIGLAADQIVGFRAPYVEIGPKLFDALRAQGLGYDCSVQEGFEKRDDGTALVWPYRIRVPGGAAQRELWEIPAYALLVPPDDQCEKYGTRPGLRARLKQAQSYFDPSDGKITGFDWNLWIEFGMRPDEFLATLKYTLDLRLRGNRAPLTLGTHSDIYSEQYAERTPNSTAEERRQALAAFIDHALAHPEVRVVTAQQVLAWVRSPVAL